MSAREKFYIYMSVEIATLMAVAGEELVTVMAAMPLMSEKEEALLTTELSSPGEGAEAGLVWGDAANHHVIPEVLAGEVMEKTAMEKAELEELTAPGEQEEPPLAMEQVIPALLLKMVAVLLNQAVLAILALEATAEAEEDIDKAVTVTADWEVAGAADTSEAAGAAGEREEAVLAVMMAVAEEEEAIG